MVPPRTKPKHIYRMEKASIYKNYDISTQGKLLIITQLWQKYLTNPSWLQYKQPHHMFRTLPIPTLFIHEYTTFEKLLHLNDWSTKHLISLLYKSLSDYTMSKLATFQNNWHKDCDVPNTTEAWNVIWSSYIAWSKVLNLRVQFYKLTTRWHLTPQTLHYFTPSSTPLCWIKNVVI